MKILDNLIIVTLHVLCFIAGLKVANYYNRKAQLETKEALEKQFLRLRVRADADDPCKPYIGPQVVRYNTQVPLNTGDTDGDNLRPITPEFMEHLKQNGQAATKFRKSDIAK